MKKFSFFTLILILLAESVYPQPDRWELGRYMTTPVAEGELVFYQTNLYLLGGYSDARQTTLNTIQSYNVTTDTWEEFGEMISPRKSFLSVATGGNLFSLGGSSNTTMLNSAEVFSIIYHSTSGIIFRDDNFNRLNSAGVLFSGEMYIVGGNPENISPYQNYPYILKYNLLEEEGEVEILENTMFANRKLPEQQMLDYHESDIYIFGGVLNGISRDIYKYAVHENILTKLNIKLLEPRAAGRAIRLVDDTRDNIIVIVGGYNETNDALSSMEYFKILGENSYRIWSGPELNIARRNFMIEQYENKLYVMGGYDDRGNVISSIEIFEPGLSDIEADPVIPEMASLEQNFPNPFNPTTEIHYSVSEYSHVSLDVYSASGEHVCCLKSGNASAGNYSVKWHSTNDRGETVPSGIYFYVLLTGNQKQIKKMVLLK